MNRKTLIQFAHLGEQIACFILICLFAGANYDLNCNSVCLSHCSIDLIRKSSKLQQEGYLLKTILLSCWLFRALGNYLSPRDKISSIVFVINNDPQLITGWAHGTTVLRIESSLKRSLPSQNT